MKIKILLIEYHTDFLTILHNYLEKLDCGIEIVEASSGEIGIKVAQQIKPDIVIVDIRLPNMNGIKTAKEIKNLSPKSEIIVLTMFDSELLRRIYKPSIIHAFICKSELYDKLRGIIKDLLKKKRFKQRQNLQLKKNGLTAIPNKRAQHPKKILI